MVEIITIPVQISELALKGKLLFQQGDCQAAFTVFEDEMLKEATTLGNASAILHSHIVLARHKMEVGDYPAADKSLD